MVTSGEREDFENELRRRGRSSEFELTYRPDATTQGFPGVAIVRHIESGAKREYSCESGPSWVIAFMRDLDGAWPSQT